MKPLHIAWDVDDMLGNFVGALIRWNNRKGYPRLRMEDVHDYNLSKIFQCPIEETIRRVDEFVESPEFEGIEPYPQTQEVVRQLPMCRHSAVTGRRRALQERTRLWVEKHFPASFTGVHAVEANPLNGNIHGKADICKEIGADVLLEDAPMHIESCLAAGLTVFFLAKPWNRQFALQHPRLIRINCQSEALPHIQKMLERDTTVYVDELFTMPSREAQAFKVGERHNHQWCHMWSENLDALHAMAHKIGMRREWFQDRPGFPHYDLVPSRRKAAVKLGAVQQSLAGWLRTKAKSAARKA